jgi:predicted acylesterase/phospholipase RssA
MKKLVYTLSGGAAYGYAHVGVLSYLEERGMKPSAVVGTSMGAVVGGLYAFGFNAEKIAEISKSVGMREMLKLFLPSFPRGGIIDTQAIREFFLKHVGDARIEDLSLPYRSVAVDIETGEEVIFDSGPLIDGMIASMSIPAVFKPLYFHGRYLVDGGVLNNLPYNIAEELGEAHVVIDVAPKKTMPKQRIYSSALPAAKKKTALKPESRSEEAEARSAEEGGKGANLAPSILPSMKEDDPDFQESLYNFIQSIRKGEDFSIKRLVASFSKKVEEGESPMSLPEIVTHVMAIVNKLMCTPPEQEEGRLVYLHPDLFPYSLNDFHKAREIIEIGYRSAVETPSFTAGIEKLLDA